MRKMGPWQLNSGKSIKQQMGKLKDEVTNTIGLTDRAKNVTKCTYIDAARMRMGSTYLGRLVSLTCHLC